MTEDSRFIEPRTLKGCQDWLPQDLIVRKEIIAKIEAVFERYGFMPVETPALEYLETLLGAGSEETNKEMFRLESPEGDAIALRFDLTVPFARVMAQYPAEIKAPFRRYAVGSSWRADKPGVGRYRQFTQLDIDAAGTESLAVDAEMTAVMCDAMAAIGLDRYRILINNRKLLDVRLESCGIHEDARKKHVLRVIDKLSKVGIENVRRELGPGRIDDSGDPIPGVKLDDEIIEKIIEFISIEAPVRADVIAKLEQVLPPSDATTDALNDMRELDAGLRALDVDDEHVRFDPSLARGLDYYTGPVFEGILLDAPEFGSVMGGGRYNRLVERFMERAVPCTGISIGIDRLFPALKKLGLVREQATTIQALIVTMGKVPTAETLKVAAELRAAGINAETYFGAKMNMKNQLSHADHYGIPVAVIIGEDEIANGVVSIKDLHAGKQQREDITDRDAYRQAGKATQVTVPRNEMVATVKRMLE